MNKDLPCNEDVPTDATSQDDDNDDLSVFSGMKNKG